MTPARWERLADLGVRRVILIPDDSETSRRNVLTAVENAFRADPAPAVWVLSPEALSPYPTGVALARARGVAEFHSLVQAGAMVGYHYKALSMLLDSRHNLKVPGLVCGQAAGARLAERVAVERLAPRPVISRPSAISCTSEAEARTDTLTRARHPARESSGTVLRCRTSSTDGGYCRIHHCDTTVCFCFD
jgi:hypothetical protein